jgi:hypothetical protein
MLPSSIMRDVGSLILTLCGVRKSFHRWVRRRIPRVRNLVDSDLRSSVDASDGDRASVACDSGWRRNERRLHQQRTARSDRDRCVCGRFHVAPPETSARHASTLVLPASSDRRRLGISERAMFQRKPRNRRCCQPIRPSPGRKRWGRCRPARRSPRRERPSGQRASCRTC